MLFVDDVLDMDVLISEIMNCENTSAVGFIVELLEISVQILQVQMINHSCSGLVEETLHYLQETHEYIWNMLLIVLHEREMLDAIEEVIASVDDDDSAGSTEDDGQD